MINWNKSVFIIAEAGVNHNGSIENAFKLIDAAVEAKVDAVKFQTFIAEDLVTAEAKKADYQIKNEPGSNDQLNMLKKLELTKEDHLKLIDYCSSKNIMFLSTAFDLKSLELLYGLGLRLFKVPSGEITNLPLLRKIANFSDVQLIASTGMSNLEEIKQCQEVFLKQGLDKDKMCFLHCNTEYPTPMEDVNLLAMAEIGKCTDTVYGYSDHTLGIEVPIAAVSLGARVIEKHFTLDKTMDGPDHKASLEPHELKEMVSSIRNIEKALGKAIKEASPSEKKNIVNIRKSIVAKTHISKGEVITEEMLTTKRPALGLSPMKWDSVVGSMAKRDYLENEAID